MPTEDSDLAAALAALSGERRRLLRRWLARERGTTGDARRSAGQLVACVVPGTDNAPTAAALREHVRARLPEFMVPQRFELIAEMPRGAGGKVDRLRLEELVAARADDESPVPATSAVTDSVTNTLAKIWAEVLGVAAVGVDENFFEVGGDSLLSIRIMARAAKAGIRIDAEQFFAHPTVAGQASVASAAGSSRSLTGPVTGLAPLTPIQHWFFEHIKSGSEHWNQCVLLALDKAIDRTTVERALQALLLYHDALRTRFVRSEDGLEQLFDAPRGELPLSVLAADTDDAAAIDALVDQTARALNASLDLSDGPLLKVAMIGAPRETLLIVTVHHLVVDAMSWRILIEDLDRLIGQVAKAAAPLLGPKGTPLKTWAERLATLGADADFARQAALWNAPVAASDVELPLDFDSGMQANNEANAAVYRQSLDAESTRKLLSDLPRRYGVQINDALLAALGIAFADWTGRRSLRVAVEGHGRESLFDDADVSRTVGWFTTVFPIDLVVGADVVDTVRSARDALRRFPHGGIGHGLLRYLGGGEVAKDLQQLPEPRVCFNYLGQIDQMDAATEHLRVVRDLREVSRAGHCPRAFLIEVNAWVEKGRLQLQWHFGTRIHRRETIESLANRLAGALSDLIRADRDGGRRAASDFPLAGLSDREFDQLARLLGEGDGEKPRAE